jgi:predicted small secreted protein
MKRTLIVIALVCVNAIGISSCATQKGCKATQGYVGYGSRH